MADNKTKILLVEDNPGDVRLVQEMVNEAGAGRFELSVEGTLDGALNTLQRGSFDALLLDLNLPDSRGIATIKSIQGNLPFLAVAVITGLNDEEIALESLKIGAEDFLIKGKFDGPLLLRAVRYAIERKLAEKELREREAKFRSIFYAATDGIIMADLETRKFIDCNRMLTDMIGFSLDEIRNMGVMDLHPKEDLPYVLAQFEKQAKGEITLAKDIPVKRKDGSVFYADVSSGPIELHGRQYLMGIFRDITERKLAEKELAKKVHDLEVFYKATMDREDRNIELKKEVNALLKELGREPKYQ